MHHAYLARWEFPRSAIEIGTQIRGGWWRGTIFQKSPCMVRMFDPATPPAAIEVELGIMKECRHSNVLALMCTVTAAPEPTWMITDLVEVTLHEFLGKKGHEVTPRFMAGVACQVCVQGSGGFYCEGSKKVQWLLGRSRVMLERWRSWAQNRLLCQGVQEQQHMNEGLCLRYT